MALAGNDTYRDQTIGNFIKIPRNVKYALKCIKRLIFNQLLMILTNYHHI